MRLTMENENTPQTYNYPLIALESGLVLSGNYIILSRFSPFCRRNVLPLSAKLSIAAFGTAVNKPNLLYTGGYIIGSAYLSAYILHKIDMPEDSVNQISPDLDFRYKFMLSAITMSSVTYYLIHSGRIESFNRWCLQALLFQERYALPLSLVITGHHIYTQVTSLNLQNQDNPDRNQPMISKPDAENADIEVPELTQNHKEAPLPSNPSIT